MGRVAEKRASVCRASGLRILRNCRFLFTGRSDFMFRDKFSKIENQMRESLAEIRETLKHSGNKGTSVENLFSGFLRQYLPRRLEIGNGEIVDSQGNRSGQADIVIVNEDHPFTFTPNKPGLFFIEGVSAIGEVKTILTSQELENTLGNSVKYKNLKMVPDKNSLKSTNQSDLDRFYQHPPFFLFGFESQLSLAKIKSIIQDYCLENHLGLTDCIDAVFVLDKGWVVNFGDGKGSYEFRTREGESVQGWVEKESQTVLFDFIGYISVTMPKLVRFKPILASYIFSKVEKK